MSQELVILVSFTVGGVFGLLCATVGYLWVLYAMNRAENTFPRPVNVKTWDTCEECGGMFVVCDENKWDAFAICGECKSLTTHDHIRDIGGAIAAPIKQPMGYRPF